MDGISDVAVGMKRGSDELSMYNSPNSGMSSISGGHPHTTACDCKRHSGYDCIIVPPHCGDELKK